MMSLPKGCVDWLVGTSHHDMFCILIPRYKESSPPPPVHNHIKKDNFFHVCTCFSDDMMAVNDSMCQCVMKWSRRTGREGLQLMRRDGDCQLMGLGAFSGALLRPALVHRYVSTQQQQTRHTRHTAFLPHSAGLYTHTTQHQNRFRAGLRSKTSLKIFFANIFHEINTVLRQFLRA